MNDGTFHYVTYINTTAAKVWDALLKADLSRLYWDGHELVAAPEWKPGAAWRMIDGAKTVKCQGAVVEFVPAKRLVLTWVKPVDKDDAEKYSRLSVDIETTGGQVKLTVAHEHLDQVMKQGVSFGWPRVLSGLKTLLETGKKLELVAPTGPCSVQ